jgi:hypothetical protein
MQIVRLAAIVCLLSTLSFPQTVIDARGKSNSEIYGHVGRAGSFGDPRHQKILSGILTITNSRNLVAGSRFDYELWVTNDSNASVVIPKTLDWNQVDDGHASQTFMRARLLMQMECLKYSSGELDLFVLYGSDQRPETEVLLKPGESVCILGSGLMPLPSNTGCQSEDSATFRIFFDVYETVLQRNPQPALPDAYDIDQRLAVVANAKRKYPITNPR